MPNSLCDSLYQRITQGEISLLSSSDSLVRDNSSYILKEAAKFSKMTINDLKEYIDAKKSKISNLKKQELKNIKIGDNISPQYIYVSDIQTAWLAAAQIARLLGYPCSAALVECSVLGNNYVETQNSTGLFRNVIATSPQYINFLSVFNGCGRPSSYSGGFIFPNNEISDLYYSIHRCSYNVAKHGNIYTIHLEDTFDFEFILELDNLKKTLINDWGWLSQNWNALKPIEIDISWRI